MKQKATLKKLGRGLVLLILLAAIGWGAYNMALVTIKKYTLEQEVLSLKAQAAALSQKHNDLVSFLDSFKNPAMLEQELRSQLNLVKPGEREVVIVPPNGSSGKPSPNSKASPTDQLLQNLTAVELKKEQNTPNWQRWWNLYFGKSGTNANTLTAPTGTTKAGHAAGKTTN